jgi:hypothetical protein
MELITSLQRDETHQCCAFLQVYCLCSQGARLVPGGAGGVEGPLGVRDTVCAARAGAYEREGVSAL